MDEILFWIIAVVLTAVVTLAVVWPMLRGRPSAVAARSEYDAEVFGAQLAELKADLERGTISAEDAKIARAEIGRRLLKAAGESEAAGASAAAGSTWRARTIAGFVALAVPAAAIGLYAAYGSPKMPDLPLEARLAVDPAKADLPTLVAMAEARVRKNPGDGAGWDLLGPIYLRSGRPDDAATAFGNAIRTLGASPDRETGLGEAQTQIAGGEVTDAAKASFERALRLNPDYLPAKFFLALDLSQENRFGEAGPAWQELIDRSPPGAPWLQLAQMAVADANAKIAAAAAGTTGKVAGASEAGAAGTPTVPPGPSGEDMAAAAQMPPEDRKTMIEGMVSQLATRLKTAPNDVEGWKRLMRSYTVLGDEAGAKGALADATAAFAAGTPERGEIEAFARGLGLPAAQETTTQ